MAVQIKKGTALGALSMTPLIDIVFLLLIFFLVATRFAEEDREIDMPLPTASESKPLIVQPQEIFINITKDGEIFVGGDQFSLVTLEDRLTQAAIQNPVNQSAIIRADKRVPLDKAVAAMNVCNKVGVKFTVTVDGES